MDQKQRLQGFLIGALLGCGLIFILLQSRPKITGPMPLKPWQGPVLYLKDFPKNEDHSWKRIRIITDPGWNRPIRLEETLTHLEHKQGSQVIERQAMEAYQAWITPENSEAIEPVLNFIKNYPLTLLSEKSENQHFPLKVEITNVIDKTDPLSELLSSAQASPYLIAEPIWVKDPTNR